MKIGGLEKQAIIAATAGMQRGRTKLAKDSLHNLQWLKEDADYGLGLSLNNAEEANNARTDRQVRKFLHTLFSLLIMKIQGE